MKKFINAAGRFGTDTIDLQQIGYGGALNGLERTEMVEQRPLTRWADARNFLQAALP